ncbi:tail fiber protein [Burkholderia phage JG068]|uniref:Tail fiber protein n=1 Tax=Burkholderia phage JG068 TaxID=1401297 RepID=U3PBB7_9CAUD|nr:tail fiber protein [Burkholderia phage JG068]AGW43622.1 tail fiber protein [Burkholderia phage JG068]
MADNLTPWLAGAAETGGRFAFNQFKGNGSTIRWGINFAGIAPGYLDRSHLKYYVTEDATGFSTDTYVVPANAFISDVILELKHPVTGQPIATGSTLSVFRDSPKQQPIPNFNDGSIIDEENLDTGFRQAVYAAAEMVDRFGVSSDKADQAFDIASQARDRADTAIATANAASAKADTAINTANNASAKADTAIATANAASSTATTAKNTADIAKATADTAKSTADAASSNATNALSNSNVAMTRSQEAKDAAAAATTTANNASTKADGAVTTANAASAKADTAISTANTAKSTADTAKSTADAAKATADGIDAKATSALSTANSANTKADTAVSTANDAKSTANAIDGKAQQALDTANAIDGKATTALNTANAANAKADQALGASDGTYNNYIKTYRNGDESGIQYLDGSRQTPGQMLWAIVAASSSNNGDLYMNRVVNGVYAGSPIIIQRSTGLVKLTSGVDIDGAPLNVRQPSTFWRDMALTTANGSYFALNTDTPKYRSVTFKTGNKMRWEIGTNDDAETGSNQGSHLFISRWADDGSGIERTFIMSRQSGLANFYRNIVVKGAPNGGAAAQLKLDSNKGQYKSIQFNAEGVLRWELGAEATPEAGGSAGTEFYLSRWADDGSFLGVPVRIKRNTGVVAFEQRPQVAGKDVWDGGNFDPNSKLAANGDATRAGALTHVDRGDYNGYSTTLGGGYLKMAQYEYGPYIDMSRARSTDYNVRLHYNISSTNFEIIYPEGYGFVFTRGSNGQYANLAPDGNINGVLWGGWLGDWINARLGERAWGGARVQWDSGIAEWGIMDIGVGIGAHTVDIPAPWVMMGMRKEGSNTRCYLRGVVLRNQ